MYMINGRLRYSDEELKTLRESIDEVKKLNWDIDRQESKNNMIEQRSVA